MKIFGFLIVILGFLLVSGCSLGQQKSGAIQDDVLIEEDVIAGQDDESSVYVMDLDDNYRVEISTGMTQKDRLMYTVKVKKEGEYISGFEEIDGFSSRLLLGRPDGSEEVIYPVAESDYLLSFLVRKIDALGTYSFSTLFFHQEEEHRFVYEWDHS